MGVELYEPRKPVVLHAILWNGVMADLADMPNLNELVGQVLSIDSEGVMLMMDSEKDGEVRVVPGKWYIVRGITGHFFIKEKGEFERTYQPVPKVLRDG